MSIEELKVLQEKIIKRNKLCNLITIVLIILDLIFLGYKFWYSKINIYICITYLFISLIILIIIISFVKSIIVNRKDIELFNKNFKSIFVLKTLKDNFDNVLYKPLCGIDKKILDKVGMLSFGDRYSSNDFISGTYKNIGFEQADVLIEEEIEEKDKDGNTETYWETSFYGRVMVFDFNKKFKSNILVKGDNFHASMLPFDDRFTMIKMEDIEFNKKFLVYAESEHEAFYVLTPHFMKRLLNVTDKFGCGLMFSFVDNRLYIAIDNFEDAFEYDVFKVIEEDKIEDDIMKDIRLITDFVDELSLDNLLFKGGEKK